MQVKDKGWVGWHSYPITQDENWMNFWGEKGIERFAFEGPLPHQHRKGKGILRRQERSSEKPKVGNFNLKDVLKSIKSKTRPQIRPLVLVIWTSGKDIISRKAGTKGYERKLMAKQKQQLEKLNRRMINTQMVRSGENLGMYKGKRHKQKTLERGQGKRNTGTMVFGCARRTWRIIPQIGGSSAPVEKTMAKNIHLFIFTKSLPKKWKSQLKAMGCSKQGGR